MSKVDRTLKRWKDEYAKPAALNQNQHAAVNALAVLFLVMAVLQVASFTEFKGALHDLGLTRAPEAWAIGLIVAEAWGALGLLSVKMHGLMRAVGRFGAVLAAGFWFIASLEAVTGMETAVGNMGYFGKYLSQTAGWWTVLEATIVMIWTVYALEITKRK